MNQHDQAKTYTLGGAYAQRAADAVFKKLETLGHRRQGEIQGMDSPGMNGMR